MSMPGEFEFYATRSGLPGPASLAEHKRAYWADQLGLSPELAAPKSLNELEWLFYRVKTMDTQVWYTLADLRWRYFAEFSGLPAGNAVGDHMAAFFASPPSSITLLLEGSPNPASATVDLAVDFVLTASADIGADEVTLHIAGISGFTPDAGNQLAVMTGTGTGRTHVLDISGQATTVTYYFIAKSGSVISNEVAIQVTNP